MLGLVSTGINRFILISTSRGGQPPHPATIRTGHRCSRPLGSVGRSRHRCTPCSSGGRHSQGRGRRSRGGAAQGLPQSRRCTRRGCRCRWSWGESNRSGAWCQGVKCGFFGGDNCLEVMEVSKWVEMGESGEHFGIYLRMLGLSRNSKHPRHPIPQFSCSQGRFSKILTDSRELFFIFRVFSGLTGDTGCGILQVRGCSGRVDSILAS